ncbi:MAG: FadR/GntR family transcriptional regulator, partial [Thermomicrobiales bacterium]
MRHELNVIRLPTPRRQNLAASVAKVLKRYILLERLAPGDRLPAERRLAEALNVSRTVLREALSQLVGEGIVERSPRMLHVRDFDRARIAIELAPIDEDDAEVQDLIELRAILEIGAIETIVFRATEEDLREIERWVVEGERRLADGESLVWADARFHAALLHTLGNRSVDAFVPLIEENLRHSLFVSPHQLGSTGSPADLRVVHEHRQILEAIRRRDVEDARHVMASHLSYYIRQEQPGRDED